MFDLNLFSIFVLWKWNIIIVTKYLVFKLC